MKVKKLLCAALTAAMLTGAASAAFADVPGHWAEKSIDRWSSYGVVVGGGDGNFNPNQYITRAQMATILCAVCGWEDAAENSFSDVKGDEWFASYILKANAAGAMSGYDGMVRPNDTITRQEAAVMMYKALFMNPAESDKVFVDQDKIASWAAVQVASMAANGYITGRPDGGFDPTGPITRAETVTILNQMVGGFYNSAGSRSQDCGRAVVCAPGVTLQNMTVSGDLILAPAVDDVETTLYNLTVNGRAIIQTGGDTLVEARGQSKFNELLVLGDGARVKFYEGVETAGVNVSASDVRITGITVGAAVTVAEGAENVYVNGVLLPAGVHTAPEGEDHTVDGPVFDIVIG